MSARDTTAMLPHRAVVQINARKASARGEAKVGGTEWGGNYSAAMKDTASKVWTSANFAEDSIVACLTIPAAL
jgi:hypothetical protein